MQSLSSMYKAAQSAPDGPDYGDRAPMLTKADLPAGTQLIVEVRYFKAGTTKNGAVKFTGISKIIEGGPGEGELWTSINFSAKEGDGGARWNKQQFAKLEALGIDEAFLSSDPSPEAIAKACEGRRFRLIVQWQKDSDFDEHQWAAIDTPSAANTAVAGTGFRPSL